MLMSDQSAYTSIGKIQAQNNYKDGYTFICKLQQKKKNESIIVMTCSVQVLSVTKGRQCLSQLLSIWPISLTIPEVLYGQRMPALHNIWSTTVHFGSMISSSWITSPFIHNIIVRTTPRGAEIFVISIFQERTLIESQRHWVNCLKFIAPISILQKLPRASCS